MMADVEEVLKILRSNTWECDSFTEDGFIKFRFSYGPTFGYMIIYEQKIRREYSCQLYYKQKCCCWCLVINRLEYHLENITSVSFTGIPDSIHLGVIGFKVEAIQAKRQLSMFAEDDEAGSE